MYLSYVTENKIWNMTPSGYFLNKVRDQSRATWTKWRAKINIILLQAPILYILRFTMLYKYKVKTSKIDITSYPWLQWNIEEH